MIPAILLASLFSIFSPARHDARQGAKQYRAGKFPESAEWFAGAERRDPSDPAWKLDLGTALGAAGRADAARAKLSEAARASSDHRIAADAFYQEGTLDLSAQKYAEAAEALRRSLILDPSRPDAQRNYEIALRNLRQPKPPPKPQPPQSEDRKSSRRPEANPRAPDRDSSFERKAGMTRQEAEALLRSLDAEQRQREKTASVVRGKDW
jgi:tetratricopeptide (TPR) repeat protein